MTHEFMRGPFQGNAGREYTIQVLSGPGKMRRVGSVFPIDAREAGADLAEDFVADGLLPGGQVVRRDRSGALPAQQHRLVPGTGLREVRPADPCEVHTDPPADRTRRAADQ